MIWQVFWQSFHNDIYKNLPKHTERAINRKYTEEDWWTWINVLSGLAATFNQLVTSPLIAMESFQALNNLIGHAVTGNLPISIRVNFGGWHTLKVHQCQCPSPYRKYLTFNIKVMTPYGNVKYRSNWLRCKSVNTYTYLNCFPVLLKTNLQPSKTV